MAIEIERRDGFTLVHTPGGGWDIHAPAKEIDLDLIRLVERRTGEDVTRWDGIERRRGAWIGWVLEREEAEAKIDREKRERLFH